MTTKEIKHIREQIIRFRQWEQDEIKAAKNETSSAYKDEHYTQARLNSCAADTLENLLIDFSMGV